MFRPIEGRLSFNKDNLKESRGGFAFENKELFEKENIPTELIELINTTPAVQEAFLLLKEKRQEDGLEDIRHMLRIAKLILSFIDEIEISPADRRDLLVAALGHDEGRAGKEIAGILSQKKDSKLTDKEYETIKGHVVVGGRFFMKRGEERVGKIIFRHHESDPHRSFYENGNGAHKHISYPRSGNDRRRSNREGEDRRQSEPDLDRLGNILSIVDIFESIGSRSYNKQGPIKDILKEKENELAEFDLEEERRIIGLLKEKDIMRIMYAATVEDNEKASGYTAS